MTGGMNVNGKSGSEPGKGGSILIVDDESTICELTADIFRKRGFNALTASNASDAIELVEKARPDVVLLDYVMPGMNGFDALSEIKKRFPDVSVVILTGRGSEEIAVELMKAGASDYILKPFLSHDLLDRVHRVLKLREAELRNRELLKERDRLLGEIEAWNRDLEERVREKTLELQRMQQEVIQTEKMSTVGYLSAGMAHEIRNPLNSIALYAQILRGEHDDAERLECLDKIEQEIRRIDGILNKLLDLVKRPRFLISDVRIDQVLESILEVLRARIEMNGILVEKEFRVVPPLLRVDRDEIEQVFTNLIINAIEEMPDGGVLKVVLESAQGHIVVRISDTGKGIPGENMSRIFDPFFTTKVSGTGLGLSVVLRIVRTHEGRIEVESEEGKGATFSVFLKEPEAPAV